YKEVVITAVAIVLILYSLYRSFHNLCPMSRWSRASWATGMIAATWTAVPLILYAVGANDNLEKMLSCSAWSTVMWITFIFCLINLLRVKRRTRAEVAMIEWKMRNQRNR
ncbi:MAG: hypothetical protein IIX34_06305, partial [Alistipes sp.]|nr:hypothetical protein [Alistipes sp.]